MESAIPCAKAPGHRAIPYYVWLAIPYYVLLHRKDVLKAKRNPDHTHIFFCYIVFCSQINARVAQPISFCLLCNLLCFGRLVDYLNAAPSSRAKKG